MKNTFSKKSDFFAALQQKRLARRKSTPIIQSMLHCNISDASQDTGQIVFKPSLL
jgi:hypothetical protein